MGRTRRAASERGVVVAGITGVTDGWMTGTRRDLDRAGAIAEIRRQSSDPDVLAEALSFFRIPLSGAARPGAERAEQLLLDAGADPAAVERHAAARLRARGHGFSLARMAEQA